MGGGRSRRGRWSDDARKKQEKQSGKQQGGKGGGSKGKGKSKGRSGGGGESSGGVGGVVGGRVLPRGKLLIIGGDLAYPNPDTVSYLSRFIRTFDHAMPPPRHFVRDVGGISAKKPDLHGSGASTLQEYVVGNWIWFTIYTRILCSNGSKRVYYGPGCPWFVYIIY